VSSVDDPRRATAETPPQTPGTRVRWARLTWQAGDPAKLASWLAVTLGVPVEPASDGAWQLDLGNERLDVEPWRREGPGDTPTRGGRLMLEPITGGSAVLAATPHAPLELAGIVWSTVDLDRAEAELDPWLLAADATLGDGPSAADPQLGASTRTRRTIALPGGVVVLAEPRTEGRLAASLARDGEGPCALYLRAAVALSTWVREALARGAGVSAPQDGPLGPAVRLRGQAVAGPQVLVVSGVATAGRVPSTHERSKRGRPPRHH
jgi:hypothetical protein